MSSSENGKHNFEALNIDEADIALFEQTGFEGAGKLRGAGQLYQWNEENTGKIYQHPVSATREDIGHIASAFWDWQKKTKASKEKNEEYVKMIQDRPGRAATILTPMSGPESKTILGAPIAGGSKSVLT